MSSKDVKQIIRDLRRDGWTVEQGRTHYKAIHPKGGSIAISVSPSDHHAVKNIKGDINRLNRQNLERESRSHV